MGPTAEGDEESPTPGIVSCSWSPPCAASLLGSDGLDERREEWRSLKVIFNNGMTTAQASPATEPGEGHKIQASLF